MKNNRAFPLGLLNERMGGSVIKRTGGITGVEVILDSLAFTMDRQSSSSNTCQVCLHYSSLKALSFHHKYYFCSLLPGLSFVFISFRIHSLQVVSIKPCHNSAKLTMASLRDRVFLMSMSAFWQKFILHIDAWQLIFW